MEENIRNYFCSFCKNNCGENCMQIQTKECNNFVCYCCINYQNNIQLELYKKYMKFDYFDDCGNKIAVIKEHTPKIIIVELRKHYDYVKIAKK